MFYVRTIGALKTTVLETDFSLTEAHIIGLLHNDPKMTAKQIKEVLCLDEGYLSRIIKNLASNGLVSKHKSDRDKRYYYIQLTSKGTEVYKELEEYALQDVLKLVSHLDDRSKTEMVNHMAKIKLLLEKNIRLRKSESQE